MQIGHLVCRVNHFELIIFRTGGDTPKSREVIPIYPTPARYASTFCPVSILSTYCKARNELCSVADTDYLFPKMSSSFEQGTERHLLTIAIPHKCLPADSFHKKFRSHLDSKELRAVGVNTIEFTSDSFKLGGQKCLVNGVVSPDFSKNSTYPNPAQVGNSQFPMYSSRKRTFDSANPN